MRRLAEVGLRAQRVAQIVRHLERLADALAQLFPRLGRLAGGQCAHLRRRDEQGGRLGTMIGRQVDPRLALPTLAGADAVRHPGLPGEQPDQTDRALGRVGRRGGKQVERQHDETVAGQKCQRLREGDMHRRLAAAQAGIVEHRQIVMHKARAMDQLQSRRRGVRQPRPVVAAGRRDRQQDRGADPRAAGADGIAQRGRQAARPTLAAPQRGGHGGIDARCESHRNLRCHLVITD